MTAAAHLIRCAQAAGVTVYVRDGALRYSAPPGALTQELRRALRDRKAEIAMTLAGDFRTWRIDGREHTFSPPQSIAQIRRWHPVEHLEPVPDPEPNPEATGNDAADWLAMRRDVRHAARELGAAKAEAIIDELSDGELSDWRGGWFGPAEIAAFVAGVAAGAG